MLCKYHAVNNKTTTTTTRNWNFGYHPDDLFSPFHESKSTGAEDDLPSTPPESTTTTKIEGIRE